MLGIECFVLKNDYEVLCQNYSFNELKNERLREYQTKQIGKEYVDGLEEFLTENTKREVSKYRNLLEKE